MTCVRAFNESMYQLAAANYVSSLNGHVATFGTVLTSNDNTHTGKRFISEHLR